jgi:hypothetical protein
MVPGTRTSSVSEAEASLSRRGILLAAGIAALLPSLAQADGNNGTAGSSDPVYSPPTDDYFDAYEDPLGGYRYISASDVQLTNALVNPNLDLVVNAGTVTIYQQVSLPGRKISILARRVIFADAGALDTSEPVGRPNFAQGDAAADGDAFGPGHAGIDGQPGGKGGNGGDVVIHAGEIVGAPRINTAGGAGGHPQSGGQGGTGLPGW